jgi:hypothetical protein
MSIAVWVDVRGANDTVNQFRGCDDSETKDIGYDSSLLEIIVIVITSLVGHAVILYTSI